MINHYGYEAGKIKFLPDKEATEENIINRLKWYVVNLEEHDHLFIYFSGHGLKDSILNTAYWLPSDVGKDKPQIKDKRKRIDKSKLKIPSHTIKDILRECEAKHIFVVADSCFSAQLFRIPPDRKTKGIIHDSFKRKSRQLFASGRDLVADGIFGACFVEFLRNNRQASIMASDLISEVKRKVISKSSLEPEGRAVEGTGDEFGEFFFFRKMGMVSQQIEQDFNALQEFLGSGKGAFDEKLTKCDTFLSRYRDKLDSLPKTMAPKAKGWFEQVKKTRADLAVEKRNSGINVNGNLNRGDRLFKKGQYQEALVQYETILKKLPDDPFAIDRIKKCQTALYKKKAALELYRDGKREEAYGYLKELLQYSPNDEQVARKVMEIDIARSRVFSEEGDDLFAHNDYDPAEELYKKALALWPGDEKSKEKLAAIKKKEKKKTGR